MKTNKFIFGGWFSTASVFDDNIPEYRTRNDHAKDMEFFYLWYLYVRKFLPSDYHIYITDNGSPISSDWFINKIKEPIQMIEESEEIDFSKKIHIKKFIGKLTHRPGWGRMWNHWLKICAKNEIDLLFISTDALIAYDLSKDTKDIDFLSTKFSRHDHDQTICFIRSHVLKNNFLNYETFDMYLEWLNQQHPDIQNEYNTERGMRRICNTLNPDKVKEMTRPDLFIHAPKKDELKNFLLNNPIESISVEDKIFIDKFIERMDKKYA